MHIQITVSIDSETQELYTFNTFDLTAVFVRYNKQVKPKGKRKWTNEKWWDRYNRRDSTTEEPELTIGIRAMALSKMMELIQVRTWNEYKPENH